MNKRQWLNLNMRSLRISVISALFEFQACFQRRDPRGTQRTRAEIKTPPDVTFVQVHFRQGLQHALDERNSDYYLVFANPFTITSVL
jgi:hypothetical protein